jgi:hypothetical protein
MKKLLIPLFIILLLVGCGKQDAKKKENEEPEYIVVEDGKQYKDDNKVKVGLYKNNKLIDHDYYTTFKDKNILIMWNIFYTDNETVENDSVKNNYMRYYNTYENIDDYKTGFYVSFYVGDKLYEKTVLNCDVEFDLTPYMYIYLYDDVNRKPDDIFIHITPDVENENTIYSSIKLYNEQQSDEITSPVTLSVFTYNGEDDFDSDGYYRGDSIYTVTIHRQ